eukprot:gnl/TRDRNA2_/TRDRNA2_112198_c3_seq1.p1 gnl/TRDRNA2_/TRDRNA2_112198_c3~~gnl/TRDRNA2_/TRDRNA2_112198_c3_seq1.p1  ORF type:complete len:507 (+),score=110.23 gnl/TRDRNA2_/TRDRNA2_112198_c3_seq1:111-1523(+)
MAHEDPENSVLDYFFSWSSLPLWGSIMSFSIFGFLLFHCEKNGDSPKAGPPASVDQRFKDDDVLAEEARTSQNEGESPSDNEAVCLQGLSHTYLTSNGFFRKPVETQAVRGISLGIRKGECFGLLGPNGAGKTTTLAVLTGELRPPSAGKVSIFGHDLRTPQGVMEAFKVLGFCPQQDPLWEFVSGRQHLEFYGRVKGVPEHELKATVDSLLFRLGLDGPDGDKLAGQYSGGMKRKLSVGISLIGHSPLLFLDEPSAAVDAGAKRHLWQVIKMRGPDQTVALTTHSMEEAEALCDRIAVQVKGQLRCLGTSLHIKSKYGSGYQLELFCRSRPSDEHEQPDLRERVLNFVHSRIAQQATLVENHGERYLFQLPPASAAEALTLGKVFAEIQGSMEAVGIVDYSLTQPSLEQVFLRFAKEQDVQEAPTEDSPQDTTMGQGEDGTAPAAGSAEPGEEGTRRRKGGASSAAEGD